MELVQHKFQEKLRGQKYFLVLDDVWNEDVQQWRDLKTFLMLGQGGSKVLVTTRSESTATMIDKENAYKLEGLSREDSWRLFEISAFEKGDELENHAEFVEIGKKIVHKCYSIPLALKVVGSLLFGQSISKWRLLEDSGLAKIEKSDNEILSTLKLSYDNLAPSLKSCFSYCAIFPKDYRIKKQMLIDLWMAQGYIMSLDGNQSSEYVAEEYLTILLRRCFFQDVQKNIYDNIWSFKIHDLMHDVAQEVQREEISLVTCVPNKLGDKIRHVCYASNSCVEIPIGSSRIRSFIFRGNGTCVVDVYTRHIESQKRLRVLELSMLDIVYLPNSIGKLQHLRYLDLSNNKRLELLPDAITRLYNLQTLLLYRCGQLRELPKDFCKLVKMRHLDLMDCGSLICMPRGMENLTSLEILTYFVAGKRTSTNDGFAALNSLTSLRGRIWIQIGENYRKVDDIKGGYLKSMKDVAEVTIEFDEITCDSPEVVLETLEPPSSVRVLGIFYFKGKRIPKWGRAVDNWVYTFSSLVEICLEDCTNLEEMPVLSKLPFLKYLTLQGLDELEYMEETIRNNVTQTEELIFFPSLVYLRMCFKKLKGWWKEDSLSSSSSLCRRLSFPCLSRMRIKCPNLTSFPSCPTVEHLFLGNTNKRLQIHVDDVAGNSPGDVRLRNLEIDNMDFLKSLPINCLTTLSITALTGDEEVEVDKLSQTGEVESCVSEAFERCASSLQTLEINRMKILRRLCGPTGLQHFTALKSLTLGYSPRGLSIPEDEVEEEDEFDNDVNNFLWLSFPHNLCSLKFEFLLKITRLPEGMKYMANLLDLDLYYCMKLKALPEWISSFSSLKSLFINNCPALKSLPQAMSQLTSLQRLDIWNCPELITRCKEPDGEDWPKIQHIPHISLQVNERFRPG